MMAQVTVTVCDECGSPERTTQVWKIEGPGGSVRLDLCSVHSRVLERLIGLPSAVREASRGTSAPAPKKKAPAKKANGRPVTKMKVISAEEIEKLRFSDS